MTPSPAPSAGGNAICEAVGPEAAATGTGHSHMLAEELHTHAAGGLAL